MQDQPDAFGMRIKVEMLDAAGVEGGGTADDAMDLIPLVQQEFGEVGAVLACDAGDEAFSCEGTSDARSWADAGKPP